MKNIIYYFTGTGNSLVVARDIAEKLGDVELIPIAKAIKCSPSVDAERIGIVFPVYIWGYPLIVAEFIKKLKLTKDKYVFAVDTCGGWPAATLLLIKDLIEKQGGSLSAGFSILMPGNYTPMYGAKPEARQKKLFENEKKKILKIADAVKNKAKAGVERNNFLVNALFTGLFYKMSAKYIHEMDKSFFADEKCNSCGICEKVCPVGNIRMISGKPDWLHNCEQCLSCLQWCPEEAIQFGKSTAKRKRYHHPDVKLKDIANFSDH